MSKYINKDAIVAEIESLRRTTFTNFDEGVNATVQTLLEIINTLEVKDVDLEKEYDRYYEQERNIQTFKLAKYFYELGLKAQKGE